MAAKLALRGTLQVPGDKSISHRALIFSMLTRGSCEIRGLSPAADCESTSNCLELLGAEITKIAPGHISVLGKGLSSFYTPDSTLFCGNSGTTIRLLSGLCAGSPIVCTFDGDDSLRKRPMSRVLDLLVKMGARIKYLSEDGRAPFIIEGGFLKGIDVELAVASAQVETAVLLAGLSADGKTTVSLPNSVRDHTKRMFKHIGVPIEGAMETSCSVTRLESPLPPFQLTVAGDISSAAFFMVAACCLPGSEITLLNVGLNPGRCLVIDVLREMGADIEVRNFREEACEPAGDIVVKYSGRLQGATIDGARLAAGIDEVPVLACAGAVCDGVLSVRDASELRVKESDRLAAICSNIRQLGARVEEYQDGFDIEGQATLRGDASWRTFGDHRLAMSGAIVNLLCNSPVAIDDSDCVGVSYPRFFADLNSLV